MLAAVLGAPLMTSANRTAQEPKMNHASTDTSRDLPYRVPEVSYRTVDVDGIQIFYREAGPREAPVIVLLHGYPSSSRMFEPLFPYLATKYRLLALDYPGF